MRWNMKQQDIDKAIKRKIESLDDTLPQHASWKAEKSWGQIQEKLAPSPKRRIIPLVYLSSVAASIILVLMGTWIFNQPENIQKNPQTLLELDSIEKENPVKQEVKPNKKQVKPRLQYKPQPENDESNQIMISAEQVPNIAYSVKAIPDKDSVIIQPKKEILRMVDVLMPNSNSVNAIVETNTPKKPKKQINQNVVLTVAPGAEVWQRERRKSSKKTKQIAPKKPGLKVKLETNSRQFALNK